MKFKDELEVAIQAACAAGDAIMAIYESNFEVQFKKDASPVTEADVVANKIILSRLKDHFPNDGFLSEEVHDDKSRFEKKRFWVIDPLDGTKEFVKKNGEFAVNIGLVCGNCVCLGVVYLPVSRKVYFASIGNGAYVKQCGDQVARPINVSDREKPYRLLISRSHPSKKTLTMLEQYADAIHSVTEMGSAIKGCLIAEGLYDVYYNFGFSMKWDTCAMECIVSEAGGYLRRLDHQPIDYVEKDMMNRGFYIVNKLSNCINLQKLQEGTNEV